MFVIFLGTLAHTGVIKGRKYPEKNTIMPSKIVRSCFEQARFCKHQVCLAHFAFECAELTDELAGSSPLYTLVSTRKELGRKHGAQTSTLRVKSTGSCRVHGMRSCAKLCKQLLGGNFTNFQACLRTAPCPFCYSTLLYSTHSIAQNALTQVCILHHIKLLYFE